MFGRTRSTLARLILPVVKAWPAITVGVLGQHDLDLRDASSRRSSAPHSARLAPGWPAEPPAEVVLAAGVEREVGRQDARYLSRKPMQAAEVVVMPVADDQRIDLVRIGADDLHVVEQRFRRVAEVEQDGALLGAALRFEKSDRPHWLCSARR